MTEHDRVRLRVHVAAAPERIYEALATDRGREGFWCASSSERDGVVRMQFSNGLVHDARVLAAEPPRRFAVEYFGGSAATFELDPDGAGGTVVTLTETSIPEAWLADQRAGWVTVLLTLKAAVDFDVDLRNPHPDRDWEHGYVDV